MAAFDAFAESRVESMCIVEGICHLPPVRKIVVADSGMISSLAKVFLLTFAQKRDDYVGWREYQGHLRLLFLKILPILYCSYKGHTLRGL